MLRAKELQKFQKGKEKRRKKKVQYFVTNAHQIAPFEGYIFKFFFRSEGDSFKRTIEQKYNTVQKEREH